MIGKPEREPIVCARGLTKCFDEITAVDSIDFEVYPGECFGILGPNGAGKTSTMRMIYGFSPRTAGELSVFGLDPAVHGVRVRKGIGVVPQSDNLDQELTVQENLEVYGAYYGVSGQKLKQRVVELMDFMDLQDKARCTIKQLSGGMKRRLTIVRALIHEPPLIILDEPTTGLDPQARHHIWTRLRDLVARGVTIVLTTHYMDEAQRLCDRLMIMHRGRILRTGAPQDLVAEHLPRLVLEVDRQDLAESWSDNAPQHDLYGDQVFFMAQDESAFKAVAFRTDSSRSIVRPANLEDLFLKLTGRMLHE